MHRLVVPHEGHSPISRPIGTPGYYIAVLNPLRRVRGTDSLTAQTLNVCTHSLLLKMPDISLVLVRDDAPRIPMFCRAKCSNLKHVKQANASQR